MRIGVDSSELMRIIARMRPCTWLGSGRFRIASSTMRLDVAIQYMFCLKRRPVLAAMSNAWLIMLSWLKTVTARECAPLDPVFMGADAFARTGRSLMTRSRISSTPEVLILLSIR